MASQLHGNGTPGAPSRSRHERDLPRQRTSHRVSLVVIYVQIITADCDTTPLAELPMRGQRPSYPNPERHHRRSTAHGRKPHGRKPQGRVSRKTGSVNNAGDWELTGTP